MNQIAKNIKRLRHQNHMTQDELAEKMFVTRQAVSNWETEKNQPDVETLTALAEVFGTDLNEIIYGNKANAYPRYQKKHVVTVSVCAAVIVVLIVVRAALLPYLLDVVRRTWSFALERSMVSLLSKAGILFALGFGIPAVFSLWADCSVRASWLCLFCAVLALLPIFFMIAEYLSWTFISENTMMRLLVATAIHEWARILFIEILPCVSGALFCLYKNRKRADRNS